MALEIYLPKKNYVFESGKSGKVTAMTEGHTNKQEQHLAFTVMGDLGHFNEKTKMFYAPEVDTDTDIKIEVACVADPSVTDEITIKVKAPQPIRIKERHVIALSGSEHAFHAEGKNISSYWSIKDFHRGMGNIEPKTGIYKAPAVIDVQKTVKVMVKDLTSGKTDEVEVTLLPIAMLPPDGTELEFEAGKGKVKLPFESHNDIKGLNNFTCAIKPHHIGYVIENHTYVLPTTVDKETAVEITAKSVTDPTKKTKVRIKILTRKCSVCGMELDSDSLSCSDCHKTYSFGAYIGCLAKVKCSDPECNYENYAEDGHCLACGKPF